MDLHGIIGFDWDQGNSLKSWLKHRVSMSECEEAFTNEPLLIEDDVKHSGSELRWFALGKSHKDRKLFICFTVRENQIRVISARPMNRTERRDYEEAEKDT